MLQATLRKIPPLVLAFLLIDGLLVLAYLGSHLFWTYTGHLKMLAHYMDLDAEANVPSWYSSIQHFCVGVLFTIGIRSQVRLSKPASWVLLGLPLMFFLFSLDETAQIHEFIGTVAHHRMTTQDASFLPERGLWVMLLGIPFLCVLLPFLKAIRGYFVSKPQVFQKLTLGLGVFLFGALGVETLSNLVLGHNTLYFLEVIVEEGMEMLGVTITLWAAYEAVIESEDVLAGYVSDFYYTGSTSRPIIPPTPKPSYTSDALSESLSLKLKKLTHRALGY